MLIHWNIIFKGEWGKLLRVTNRKYFEDKIQNKISKIRMFITNNSHSESLKTRKTKLPSYGSILFGGIRICHRGNIVI